MLNRRTWIQSVVAGLAATAVGLHESRADEVPRGQNLRVENVRTMCAFGDWYSGPKWIVMWHIGQRRFAGPYDRDNGNVVPLAHQPTDVEVVTDMLEFKRAAEEQGHAVYWDCTIDGRRSDVARSAWA